MQDGFSELLRRAKSGEPAAMGELHARYERRVLGVVRRRLGPGLRRRCDTLDVAQSVFEDVLRDLPGFEDRGEAAFRHWLNLKAENKVRDAWRRQLRPQGGQREDVLSSSAAERVPADVSGPSTQASDDDDRARLRELLESLPAEQRELISLRDTDGLSFSEIADRLRIASADAARMRYARALMALRKRWESQ